MAATAPRMRIVPDGTCVNTGDVVLGQICDGGTNPGGDCTADTDCPGGTCGGGVVIPTPTGQIQVNYICPGSDEGQFDPDYEADPDPENGTIKLTMTLDSAGIGRVVWGTADKCLYLVPIEGGNCEAAGCSEASYDGGVAVDLGDPAPSGQDITELIVTFLLEGTIGFEGSPFDINQSFRVTLANTAGLVILVDVGDPALSQTFNYIFAGTAGQAIRDSDRVVRMQPRGQSMFRPRRQHALRAGSSTAPRRSDLGGNGAPSQLGPRLSHLRGATPRHHGVQPATTASPPGLDAI